MLYYRKTKSRSADFLGVTLVYTIESFKYSLLFLRRYTDSVIPYGNLDPILKFIYGYFYKSVFFIIFYGVIAKIKNNLVNYLLYSVNNCTLAPKLKLYSLLLATGRRCSKTALQVSYKSTSSHLTVKASSSSCESLMISPTSVIRRCASS